MMMQSQADPDISMKGKGGGVKAICFTKKQKIARRDSKRKLQSIVKRKITRTKLEIF